MIPRRVMLFSVLLLVVVVGSSSAWAQFTSGIEGTVTDPTGAVVSGATVTIKNEETGAVQTFQTQESGSFRFTTLPSSAFSISVAAPGFKTTVQDTFGCRSPKPRLSTCAWWSVELTPPCP